MYFSYTTINNDKSSDRNTASVQFLIEALEYGYKIVSAVSNNGEVHYVIAGDKLFDESFEKYGIKQNLPVQDHEATHA